MEAFFVLEFTRLGPQVVDVRYKHMKCSVCGIVPVARIGGIGVRFAEESELADFSRSAAGALVRQSVVDHLTEARISGWRPGCVRVETVSRLRDQDVNYCELVIIGETRGYAERVGLQVEKECEECGRRRFAPPREGLVIPKECWDGSDIFIIGEFGLCVVTEPFRQVVEKHQHTGVEFIPVDEWRDPFESLRDRRHPGSSRSVSS
jgi:hypothetical protein